jgi:membrane-associated phospholipid phosphatase
MNPPYKYSGLIMGALLFAILSALMIGLYLSGAVSGMDQAAIEFVASFRTEGLTAFFSILTSLGGAAVLAPLGVVLLIAMYVKGYRAEAAAILLTLGVGEVLNELLKAYFARPRPVGVHLIDLPDSYSFPSGHAMISPAFYCMLAYICRYRFREKSWSLFLQPVVFMMVLLLAGSRVYLGVHFLSDVLAGFCLSMVGYFIARFVYVRWMGRRQDTVRPIVQTR